MFGERTKEKNPKTGEEVSVFKTPKYMEAYQSAFEIVESNKFGLQEKDFWIQKNMNKAGTKMIYSGIIISHNGCLKINDHLKDKFKPECVTIDKDGYQDSLVFLYCSPEQGLFEAGEVNQKNCKIDYFYAMALKRMFDRVVLKLSKLAYQGIYADTESDEFSEDEEEKIRQEEETAKIMEKINLEPPVCPICGKDVKPAKNKEGNIITAQEIFEKYGMCLNCVREQNESST